MITGVNKLVQKSPLPKAEDLLHKGRLAKLNTARINSWDLNKPRSVPLAVGGARGSAPLYSSESGDEQENPGYGTSSSDNAL